MLKAIGQTEDGRYLIILGLSAENMARMRQEPIFFDPAELNLPHGAEIAGISLFAGETEATMAQTLKAILGPGAVVHDLTGPAPSGKPS